MPERPLSNDKIQRLLPTLPAIALSIRESGTVSDLEARDMLNKAKIDDEPWAVNELSAWITLLKSVYNETNQARVSMCRQCLIARGIPEANALLAIGEITETSYVVENDSRQPEEIGASGVDAIRVSSSSLGFGRIRVGSGATQQLSVSGGPGAIHANCDKISVHPNTFQEIDTTISVTVAPSNDETILSGRLIFRNQRQTVEIDVSALWYTPLGPGDELPPVQPWTGSGKDETNRNQTGGATKWDRPRSTSPVVLPDSRP